MELRRLAEETDCFLAAVLLLSCYDGTEWFTTTDFARGIGSVDYMNLDSLNLTGDKDVREGRIRDERSL